jgi:hypothetical protein
VAAAVQFEQLVVRGGERGFERGDLLAPAALFVGEPGTSPCSGARTLRLASWGSARGRPFFWGWPHDRALAERATRPKLDGFHSTESVSLRVGSQKRTKRLPVAAHVAACRLGGGRYVSPSACAGGGPERIGVGVPMSPSRGRIP